VRQLSLEAVFATREDLPSAHGERGNVCEFVWVVSIENEGIAIVQRQLGGFPFARCVVPPIFRWRICLIAPAPVDRNIQGLQGLIRPPRLAGSPCGLRLRLRPKRFRSLGVFRYQKADRGRRSVYRFRHFVQGLLVRKLLWERLPSEPITVVMSGRSTEETERMFLGGTEMVFRSGEDRSAQGAPASGTVETWRRVQVMPGVELHVRGDLPRLRQAELRQLLERVEIALRGLR